jgi:hypothetical protein
MVTAELTKFGRTVGTAVTCVPAESRTVMVTEVPSARVTVRGVTTNVVLPLVAAVTDAGTVNTPVSLLKTLYGATPPAMVNVVGTPE